MVTASEDGQRARFRFVARSARQDQRAGEPQARPGNPAQHAVPGWQPLLPGLESASAR